MAAAGHPPPVSANAAVPGASIRRTTGASRSDAPGARAGAGARSGDGRYPWAAPPASVTPDETARAFLRRVCGSGSGASRALWTGMSVLDDGKGLVSGDVVELQGDSGSGKTEVRALRDAASAVDAAVLTPAASQLLLRMVATCVLPKAAGGLESRAVFFDCGPRLPITRLAEILDASLRLSGGLREEESDEAYSAARRKATLRCLRRLHVARCADSVQLLLSLLALGEGCVEGVVPPRLVVIDSVGARFAQDKAWEPGHGRGLQSRIAAALSELKRDGATIAFSRAIPADRRSAAPETAAREHLSPAWLELVTKRVKLARIARRQHQPDPPAEGRSMVWQEIEARRATAAAAPRIMAVRPVTSDANFAVITSAGVLPEPL